MIFAPPLFFWLFIFHFRVDLLFFLCDNIYVLKKTSIKVHVILKKMREKKERGNAFLLLPFSLKVKNEKGLLFVPLSVLFSFFGKKTGVFLFPNFVQEFS